MINPLKSAILNSPIVLEVTKDQFNKINNENQINFSFLEDEKSKLIKIIIDFNKHGKQFKALSNYDFI